MTSHFIEFVSIEHSSDQVIKTWLLDQAMTTRKPS